MLEGEAKTKWCPMYRAKGDFSDNRWSTDGSFARESVCLGSKCGCWVDNGYYDIDSDERIGRCGLAMKR